MRAPASRFTDTRSPSWRPLVAAAASVALLLTGCSAGTPPEAGPRPSVSVPTAAGTPTATASPTAAAIEKPLPVGDPEVVVAGLAAPWSIVFTADGTPIVDERDTRRILEVLPGGTTREIGVVGGGGQSGESGVLGLALDDEDRLYVYSTVGAENRIDRFPLLGEAGELRLGDPEAILTGIPAARFHNGGRLAFGPDGMLYATTGDARDGGTSQDAASLAGKILRMTPDGGVPADNPFPGSLVYTLGHRNPQGIAWAADGTMFASEFGQDTWDELNIIVAGGNYGWPIVEGMGGGEDGFVEPVLQWTPDDASPSGVAIVGDTVFIASLRGEVLWTTPTTAPAKGTAFYRGEYGRLRDAVLAPDGTLWLLTNNTDGRGSPREGDDRILSVRLG